MIYPGRTVEQYVERFELAHDHRSTTTAPRPPFHDHRSTTGASVVVDFSGGVAGLVAGRVFARLGIGAAIVEGFANANAYTTGTRRTSLADTLDRVGRIVPTVGAAFGAVVGPTGEDVQFADDAQGPSSPRTSCWPA